jgi:hypothetical protein
MAPSNLELAYFQEQLMFTQKMEDVLYYSFKKAIPIIELLETNVDAKISQEQAEMLEALTARIEYSYSKTVSSYRCTRING